MNSPSDNIVALAKLTAEADHVHRGIMVGAIIVLAGQLMVDFGGMFIAAIGFAMMASSMYFAVKISNLNCDLVDLMRSDLPAHLDVYYCMRDKLTAEIVSLRDLPADLTRDRCIAFAKSRLESVLAGIESIE